MIDFRLYRVAFLPAALVLIALLFSFEPIPGPVESSGVGVSVDLFDESQAAATARRIAKRAPEREPGSEGDAAIADLVRSRFEPIPGGLVAEQRYDSSFEGDGVELRNVILTLPGESERTVAVLAARDAARGAGAASSAAATGTLLELARGLGASRHTKTVVLVSTDGGSDGATGARQFADSFSDTDLLDGIVVIAQPGAGDRRKPHVLVSSTTDRSASIQLARTAERALALEGLRAGFDGTLGALARLALPSGLGEQAVLIEQGFDAIAISGAGEAPLPLAEDGLDNLSAETLGQLGRATLATVFGLDATSGPLEHGPDSYVRFAGNLVPGWALSLLALALILPAAVAAVDGVARAARGSARVARGLAWAAARALPPLAGLILLYLLALIGIASDPRFPFDPGRFSIGVRAVLTLLLLAGTLFVAARAFPPLPLPRRLDPEVLTSALGLLAAVVVLSVWVANPYLALLLVPLAHVWLLLARRRRRAPDRIAVAVVVLALVPPVAAVVHVASSLDLGADAPWHLLLMVADGQIGFLVALAACGLIGYAVGILGLSAPAPGQPARRS